MSKKTLIIIGVVVVLALGFFMTSQRRNQQNRHRNRHSRKLRRLRSTSA